ncbi:MAG: L-glyceraldehyde 3-phosphate reductase [Verrucomicrobiaceae bacterium]|nr:L-glyceraldehyde 3-phosphate reductase [Verrucomicrobiaceae bacterium]
MTYAPDPLRYDGRMPYRRCGKHGIKLPAITLGFWHNFGGGESTENQREMVFSAFDSGITHFDLANNYGPPYGSAETNAGRILSELPRHEILVSTKAGYDMWPGPYGEWGSRKYLLNSLDQSLQRLAMPNVDFFYSHRFDPETPMEETLGALNSAVDQGKALYAGISSYNMEQTRQAEQICRQNGWAPIVIHQPNYSMFNRWIEGGLQDEAGRLGIGIIAFCPLYQGLLTDKYLSGIPKGSRADLTKGLLREEETGSSVRGVIEGLNGIARDRGQTLAQMALSWVLRDERVTSALIGASSPAQIIENCEAVKNLDFEDDEISEIDALLGTVTLPPSLWAGE